MAEHTQEDITQDGGVTKLIVKAGQGSTPTLHARCLVHYIGKLKESGSVFMDTRAEGEAATLVAGRDSVLQGAGLNLAVAEMRVGEIAEISVAPKYGYGTKGSFSFPCVPPQSELVYTAELLGYDNIDESRPSSSMMYEDRLEAAERRRLEGNRLFRAGSWVDALGKYSMALSYMGHDFMFQLQGQHEEKANAVRLPVLLNMAACHIQLSDYHGAIDAATQVLAADASSIKARFRRGKAHRLAGHTDEAKRDLEAARKLSPRDSAILKEIQLMRHTEKEEQSAADKLFRGRFPKAQMKHRASFWRWLCGEAKRLLETLVGLFSQTSKPHYE